MKEYKKVQETYESKKLIKCTCDRCGNECDLNNNFLSKYSDIHLCINWASDRSDRFQLCTDCTKELINFFTKADTAELKEDIEFWLKD